MTIKDLKPEVVWKNFYRLTQCPRPSKHEEVVREHLLKWAKEHKVEAFADPTGNVIMRVPATPGYENRKGVILQGHMDMVPQKLSSSSHDFLKDPIETIVDGDWVKANGTTLGADNGLGVALAMSVAESKDVKHGPVEVLVTYDEETGMTGASNLPAGLLKGDILLNLDSEEEGELCIGCAGGLDAIADFKYEKVRIPAGYVGYKLIVKGLSGGHSGMDISLYRANANKLLAHAILPGMEKFGVKLVEFNGGSLRNAIPFEGEAVVAVPAEGQRGFKRSVNKYFDECKSRFKESDPEMLLTYEKVKKPVTGIDDKVGLNVIKSIIMCPTNVIRMSQTMQGLTETSINLAVVRTKNGHVTVASLMRSAINASKAELATRVRLIFEAMGAKVKLVGGYPGWVPKPDMPMIKIMNDTYERMYGRKMDITATHGGLECAILGAKYPNWEMLSIGPTVRFPHSPDEKCYIPSVQSTWEFLKAVLEAVPEK